AKWIFSSGNQILEDELGANGVHSDTKARQQSHSQQTEFPTENRLPMQKGFHVVNLQRAEAHAGPGGWRLRAGQTERRDAKAPTLLRFVCHPMQRAITTG